MGFRGITKAEFDDTYSHIEDLRKAGKLEQEVDLATVLCILEPMDAKMPRQKANHYIDMASATCIMHPVAHPRAHADQKTKDLDTRTKINSPLSRVYARIRGYFK